MAKTTDGEISPMSGTKLALKYDFKEVFTCFQSQ